MNRLEEIQFRLNAIGQELDKDGADVDALNTEADALIQERAKLEAQAQTRQALRSKIASGVVPATVIEGNPEPSQEETRAADFARTRHMEVSAEETRSVLVSSGNLATPTHVGTELHDIVGAKVSSIADLVTIVNAEGMGKDRVAIVKADADEADTQTEGSPASAKEGTFGYVDIDPTSIAATAQISKQAKKQTPVLYSQKVKNGALLSLKKKVVSIVVNALKTSDLHFTLDAKLNSSKKGVIDNTTLKTLVLNFGGNEGVEGAAWLFLNKADLIAFGEVKDTNGRDIYDIVPDTNDPNIGVIKCGALAVKYCICSKLTALSGTAQTSTAIPTMYYGQPKYIQLDLFSKYEINVSSDYAITSLMDTIVGDAEVGAAVVAKNGFVAYTIKANA